MVQVQGYVDSRINDLVFTLLYVLLQKLIVPLNLCSLSVQLTEILK